MTVHNLFMVMWRRQSLSADFKRRSKKVLYRHWGVETFSLQYKTPINLTYNTDSMSLTNLNQIKE